MTPRVATPIGRALLVGLLLATVAGATATAAPKRRARKAPAPTDSNAVLVRIGSETLTRADVQRRIEMLPEQFRANYTTPDGRRQLLERMVEERVWLNLAVKDGVAKRPEVQRQLEQQRRDLLVRTYVNEVMSANPAPSDSEVQAYYDEHLADYRIPATVTVRHILTRSESEGKRVRQWAQRKPQDWDALVKRYSIDKEGHANGGSLGTVTREGVFPGLGSQPAIAESAFALGKGGIGGPIKTDKGWHVVKVEDFKAETSRPFDQVRPGIVRNLSSKRQQDYYRSQLDAAREKLGVRPDSTVIKAFITQRKSARDLFNEAQALTAPEARLEAYRQLLAEYPESDVSPQAQFMVGFIYSEELKKYDEAEAAFRELLRRYPKAELAASAQWMIDHMRNEEAPAFIDVDADSAQAGHADHEAHANPKRSDGKP